MPDTRQAIPPGANIDRGYPRGRHETATGE